VLRPIFVTHIRQREQGFLTSGDKTRINVVFLGMEEQKEDTSEKKKKGGKGKETLYRVAYRNQIALIQIADNKANLIISINTMIISSIIAISGYGVVAHQFETNRANIIVPIAFILLSCLVSAIFAIQAAKPKLIKPGKLAMSTDKSSLIFFGMISTFSQEEYLGKMKVLRESEEDVYETMNIDLHNQGLILNRKYALLNKAYRVFMFGFILSVWVFLAFLVAG
jgi:Family of unknown function (DUF5706)